MIVVWVFRKRPLIKKLVHYNETHPISKIKKIASGIMSVSNGVHAELSQFRQASLPNRKRHCCPERASVVMKAHAFDLEVVPIHPEAGGGVEMKFANPKGNGLFVNDLGVCANCCNGFVNNALSYIPKLWMTYIKSYGRVKGLTRPDR